MLKKPLLSRHFILNFDDFIMVDFQEELYPSLANLCL